MSRDYFRFALSAELHLFDQHTHTNILQQDFLPSPPLLSKVGEYVRYICSIVCWLIFVKLASESNRSRQQRDISLLSFSEDIMSVLRLARFTFRSLATPRLPIPHMDNASTTGPLLTYQMLSETQCPLFDPQMWAFTDPELLYGFKPSWGLDEQPGTDTKIQLNKKW